MKWVLFYHSLLSDWNHGNAHFLRGIVAELQARGHVVDVYEPEDAWSLAQMLQAHGDRPVREFQQRFPALRSRRYRFAATTAAPGRDIAPGPQPGRGMDPIVDLDLDAALEGADVVLVHEWNDPALVAAVGRHAPAGCRVLFHDTHHRSVSAPHEMARYDLSRYDGVLAFGEAVRQRYLAHAWCERVWTWHEAADARVFQPLSPAQQKIGDLVWIGNWGDDERAAELRGFLVEPVRALRLKATVHGVRYPAQALSMLAGAGIDYRGWLPNYRAPEVFAQYRTTIHVPRRPYVRLLPGIPTIRVFEALACGIPLVSAHWDDVEGLFSPGRDFLMANDGAQMRRHLRSVLQDADLAAELAANGLATITSRHTCAHRIDELLSILSVLENNRTDADRPPTTRSLSHV
jgi:spore maturation protein CgeB